MPLTSPLDDFERRSLATYHGLFSRLLYIARLKGADGDYAHWGLSNTLGQGAAQQAIAQAHRRICLQIERSPFAEVLQDLCESAKEMREPLTSFFDKLLREQCLPPLPYAGSAHHLRFIFLLAQAKMEDASNPAASSPL